jgi:hypothetical protein
MATEFTYEMWREQHKVLLPILEKWNAWRRRTKHKLLADTAPRIAALSTRMYRGCGFHYSKEKQLAKLIVDLSIPMQWDANWCAKIPDDRMKQIMWKVSASMLFADVRKAERSAAAWARKSAKAAKRVK